jgi:hypothetical protein
MLKVDGPHYDEALMKMAQALKRADDAGVATYMTKAAVALEALGRDFDVEMLDPGPELDTVNDVWPESDLDLCVRAFAVHPARLPLRGIWT